MGNPFKKVFEIILTSSYSRTISIIVILLIAAAIPLTVVTLQKQQEIRQRAQSNCIAGECSIENSEECFQLSGKDEVWKCVNGCWNLETDCKANNQTCVNNSCVATAGSRVLNVNSSGISGVSISGNQAGTSGTTNYTINFTTQDIWTNLTAPVNKFTGWTGCAQVSGSSGEVCTSLVGSGQTITVTANYSAAGSTPPTPTQGGGGSLQTATTDLRVSNQDCEWLSLDWTRAQPLDALSSQDLLWYLQSNPNSQSVHLNQYNVKYILHGLNPDTWYIFQLKSTGVDGGTLWSNQVGGKTTATCAGATPTVTCSDGTVPGQCSSTKPKYCNPNGTLVNACPFCGCPSSQTCQNDGSCTGATPTPTPTSTPTIPNCNSGKQCTTCTAPTNTCGGSGTQVCTFTTFSGGGACNQVSTTQSCSGAANNCTNGNVCQNGQCVPPGGGGGGNPTATPTPTGTGGGGGGTQFALTIGLDGLGTTGDNATPTDSSGSNKNPKRPSRSATVQVYNSSNSLVTTKNGAINYNNGSGMFTGTIDMGTLASGNYIVKIKSEGYLRRQEPETQSIKTGKNNTLPQIRLVTGDINGDNAINILDYNILISCSTIFSVDNHAACNGNNQYSALADLDDNGAVNQFDYNLFLRELSVPNGD